MNTHSKPLVRKRALLIAIRHVHGKAGSKFGNLPDLPLAHRDAKALRDLLIASHGYQTDDIILMIDDKSHPEHLWPTRDRIFRQIDRRTSEALEDSHFFFYFSGHGLEEDGGDRASMRADGQDDEIVSADGKPILDYILHDRLVTPLQSVKGSKLFALIDCHSEALLDLQRGNEPSSSSGKWNIEWRSPPASKTEQVGELSVTCLSACKDGQLAHDDCARGLTFTKCFKDAMVAKPNVTWTEPCDALKWVDMGLRNSLSTRN